MIDAVDARAGEMDAQAAGSPLVQGQVEVGIGPGPWIEVRCLVPDGHGDGRALTLDLDVQWARRAAIAVHEHIGGRLIDGLDEIRDAGLVGPELPRATAHEISDGAEVVQGCRWQLQKEWSNADHACVQDKASAARVASTR